MISSTFDGVRHVFRQTLDLIRFFWALEGRTRQTIHGVFLYILVVILIASYVFGVPEGPVWLGVFWILTLFSAVNIGVLSYAQDSGGRRWYLLQLASPVALYLARSAYMYLFMMAVTGLSVLLMAGLFGWPVRDPAVFLAASAFGCLGYAVLFGFLSAIGSQVRTSAMVNTVIGFPLVIGLTLLAVKVSRAALVSGLSFDRIMPDLGMLAGLDLILFGVGLLLFPYIWRD